jgi:hypothetical protein
LLIQQLAVSLFHNRGQTEARVRDIEYTGQWPATLPDDIRMAQ